MKGFLKVDQRHLKSSSGVTMSIDSEKSKTVVEKVIANSWTELEQFGHAQPETVLKSGFWLSIFFYNSQTPTGRKCQGCRRANPFAPRCRVLRRA
jgi:hypothetical protein